MNYLDWHYLEMWPKIIVIWRNLTLFPFYFFGVVHHISTLFYPWKKQLFRPRLGFHPDDILSVLLANIFSRIIAASLRIFIVSCGIILMVATAAIGIIPVVLWVLIPGITLPLYLNRKLPEPLLIEKLLARTHGDLSRLIRELMKEEEGKFIVSHLGLDWKSLYSYFLKQKDTGDISLLSDKLSSLNRPLTLSDLFEAAASVYPAFTNILDQADLSAEKVREVGLWYERLQKIRPGRLFSDLARIKTLPEIGFQWAYGYTTRLDQYATDLTDQKVVFPILAGRDKELEILENILIKTERNNCLIVGQPGVARHRLIETLAHRIASGACSKMLSHKRFMNLNMHAVISAKPSIMEVKGLFNEILSEAESAGNIIIVIDEIDKYLSNKPGKLDLSDVLSKFAQSSVGVIGITTPASYDSEVQTNPSLSALFDHINLEPPDLPTVLYELEVSIAPVLEQKYGMVISFQALEKTVEDANRFLSKTPFPAKAIELLDEACLYAGTKQNQKVLNCAHIETVLSQKFRMPLGEINKDEKEKLMHLEELLHERIINQETAIRTLAGAARRARLDVASSKKPFGSFLFLGPTGVGKTETAKALAQIFFGSEDFLIRFDMSQYQKEEGLERLIGSVKLGTPGELTSKLSNRPYALVLLDEIEKADQQIENLLLTMLDEGYLTNAMGNKINATNSIIIATSNAGAEFIRESINKSISGVDLTKTLVEYVLREEIFSPEFLNRFDAVVVFTPLSEGHLREVAKLMLKDLNKRLTDKNISVAITPQLIQKLAAAGFDPQFGARAMRRLINNIIEDQIAKKLLSGNVKKREELEIEI